jgi:predicted transcriptional regulator of viral defense system
LSEDALSHALAVFRSHGGVLRTSEALKLAIHPRTLYRMHNDGLIDQVSWGVYRLSELPDLAYPDLVTVALRVPRAVICLISALAYHEATTEIPHEVQIALPRGVKAPQLDYPPVRVFWFSGSAFSEGVETVNLDGVAVHIYSLPKTVADCFRFRNKLGLDVAIEALTTALQKGRSPADILRYARLCRVEQVMLPYLQAHR